MTTSGTSTFSRNRDQIIAIAAYNVGDIAAGETPSSDVAELYAVALNAMVKHWQGTGVQIWTMAEATLFLQADQTSYTLSSTTTDHCAETYVQTAIAADVASGQTAITVDSITGIAASDKIGVQLDDGSFHWTTVNGAPSGSTVTLTLALTDSVSDGAVVLTYTSNIVRPLEIVAARRHNLDSLLDTPIEMWDRKQYFDQPNKTNSGVPNGIFYDRKGGANASGLAYIWQPQSSPTDAVKYTWKRPIQDFNAAGDDPDLPPEWIKALAFNLALDMAIEVPAERYARIEKQAMQSLAQVTWWETELMDVQFVPARRR